MTGTRGAEQGEQVVLNQIADAPRPLDGRRDTWRCFWIEGVVSPDAGRRSSVGFQKLFIAARMRSLSSTIT